MSHPSWVRGLKLTLVQVLSLPLVAPLVGAWIETGAKAQEVQAFRLSHPSWVRGLKPKNMIKTYKARVVAPLVGAWIETENPKDLKQSYCRTPRGCVD